MSGVPPDGSGGIEKIHTYQVFKVMFNFKNWLYNQANIRQDIFFKVYALFFIVEETLSEN